MLIFEGSEINNCLLIAMSDTGGPNGAFSRADRGYLDPGSGLPDGIFSNKNPNLGTFWRVLQRKILECFINIWSISRPFDICYSYLFYFVVIWYIFPRFGILYQEKSGNLGSDAYLWKMQSRYRGKSLSFFIC
jgi:hypothetical protein